VQATLLILALALLPLGCEVVAPETKEDSASGRLRAEVSTSGQNVDPDGYTIAVNDSVSKDVGPNGSAAFADLGRGNLQVELSGIAANCSVEGSNPRTVSVAAESTTSTSYSISCVSTGDSDLTVHPRNPHYLQDGSNTIVLIGGGGTVHPSSDGQLSTDKNSIDEWASFGANFARIWTILPWEGTNTIYPWKRTGPGTANDGGPKFDLTKLNEAFFDRMDELLAHNPDFYLQYMVFDEVGLETASNRWDQHPFNPDNNINNLGLPPTGSDAVPEFYDTSDADLMQIQEKYVQKVIDELDHHPNIICEIANETTAPWDWQKKWIDFIEARSDVLIANNPFGGRTKNLNYGPLDIVNYHNLTEENTNSGFVNAQSAAKVLKFDEQASSRLDTSEARQVAWQAFTAGGHINWDEVRNVGVARTTSDHLASFVSENNIDPATMAPDNGLVSTGFALANPGTEYIVFVHKDSSATIDLSAASGSLTAKWYDTATGAYSSSSTVDGGKKVTLTNPFEEDVVLYVAD